MRKLNKHQTSQFTIEKEMVAISREELEDLQKHKQVDQELLKDCYGNKRHFGREH
jgi:hypothetical protein